MNTINCRLAKEIVKRELDERSLKHTKLTARTVGFQDLARASCVFVKIHGWEPNEAWDDLRRIAIQKGFRIE